MLPTEDGELDADEVVILKLEDSNAPEMYSSVEDERTLNAVFAIFKERFKDVFNFAD